MKAAASAEAAQSGPEHMVEYRAKSHLDTLTWLLLNGLMWVGVGSIAWNLFKPGGWLYWAIDLIARNQPAGYYYLGLGVLGVLAGKVWLDSIEPRAFRHLLCAACAFAGTLFILGLVLPL
jgi:hypothetical protein